MLNQSKSVSGFGIGLLFIFLLSGIYFPIQTINKRTEAQEYILFLCFFRPLKE